VTVNVHVVLLPAKSSDVMVTVVVPVITEPAVGTWDMAGAASQLSVDDANPV